MRLPLYVLFTFLSAPIWGQTLYTGRVSDVATGGGLGNASIEVLDSDLSGYTDAFGNFVIEEGIIDQLSEITFFNNSLIWNSEYNLSLKLINLDGRIIRNEPQLGTSGIFTIPGLNQGIYVMEVRLENREYYTFKLLSDGTTTIAVDKSSHHLPSESSDEFDTLRVSKPGYYNRDFVVPRRPGKHDIKLLAEQYENLEYFTELIAPVAFEVISSDPARSNFGGVRAIKLVYDQKTDELYYINTKQYDLHYTFARDVLGFNQGHFVFNQTQYRRNSNRYLWLANLNYHISQDRYVLQFVSATELNCNEIEKYFNKILETSFLGEKLHFFPNLPDWEACTEVKQVSSEELYEGQNYQAMNLAEGYGYLRKVEVDDLEDTYVGRRDIVLLNAVPNDVSVVAGIITTEFQTALSHINVLSNSRGTPNMALRDGWYNPEVNDLIGELVYLRVDDDEFTLRPASIEEATAFWSQNEPQNMTVLDKNVTYSDLVDMEAANIGFINRVGGKAANFAEMMNVTDRTIPVPENSFAIPFHYYERHMVNNGLDVVLEEMLGDEQFQNDPSYRKAQLLSLQTMIKTAPIDSELVNDIRSKISNFQEFEAFRFRSSTNAEDLEFFSGAGLYDSYSAKKNHSSKTIENAVRKVWASLWNWRAYEERSYFKIDHRSCAMGILVHRSFPDEDANGVLVSKNLYNENPGYIINVQYKEYSIVYPEPGIIHDQIMLFTWSVDPNEDFMIEYLTHSNVPELNGNRVMTDQEIKELGYLVTSLKNRFYYHLPHDCNCSYQDFGLDIEFKIDSQTSPRKIYIKQARLFR